MNELREIFAELWNYAPVLTEEILKRFAQAHNKFHMSDPDELRNAMYGAIKAHGKWALQ
jgi:hypothetical protein